MTEADKGAERLVHSLDMAIENAGSSTFEVHTDVTKALKCNGGVYSVARNTT